MECYVVELLPCKQENEIRKEAVDVPHLALKTHDRHSSIETKNPFPELIGKGFFMNPCNAYLFAA